MSIRKPELLAPAGNLEKLKVAFAYGADAVYMAGKRFGLRAFAGNFQKDEIQEAVEYAHSINKKVYVTMNIFAHNEDIRENTILAMLTEAWAVAPSFPMIMP
jgi:putative protease